MTVDLGRWHEVDPRVSVMVLAVPRRNLAGYALACFDAATIDRVRVDWDALVTWGLAEIVNPPATVTDLHPKDNP